MKDSKKLRFIDKTIGVLVCFILSMIKTVRMPPRKKLIQNVLVIELFEMGAAIMIYPSLKYIKNRLPGVNIYCLTLESMKGSWQKLGIIPEKNILTVKEKNIWGFLISLVRRIIELRRKQLNLTIDFELFMRISSIIAFLVKSRWTAGFYRYDFEGLYRSDYDIKCAFNQNSHISKNFFGLTKAALNFSRECPNYKGEIKSSELELPGYISNAELKLKVKQKVKDKCAGYKDNRLILIAPDVGENLPMRNYPKDYFVILIKKLLVKYPDYRILLIGVKNNFPISEYIRNHVNDARCINFCGESSFSELFELLKLSSLVISNDNGPAHFASITQTKTIALFSTDSPYVYGPLGKCVIIYSFYQCSPCICAYNHKTSRCRNNICLRAITPETVFNYCVKILQDKLEYNTINGKIRYV